MPILPLGGAALEFVPFGGQLSENLRSTPVRRIIEAGCADGCGRWWGRCGGARRGRG